MIRPLLALAVLAPAGAVALATTDATGTAGSPLVQDGGWIQIFDGKTLDGWTQRNGTATYEVVDGAIVGTTAKGSPNSFLCSNEFYGDFELELDVKLFDTQLNSGVQIRSHSIPTHKNGRVHGYQVEVASNGTAGFVYDEARRGWLSKDRDDPAKRAAWKKGEWNRYRIICLGSTIRTFVNGVPVAHVEDDWSPTGFIGLQSTPTGRRSEVARGLAQPAPAPPGRRRRLRRPLQRPRPLGLEDQREPRLRARRGREAHREGRSRSRLLRLPRLPARLRQLRAARAGADQTRRQQRHLLPHRLPGPPERERERGPGQQHPERQQANGRPLRHRRRLRGARAGHTAGSRCTSASSASASPSRSTASSSWTTPSPRASSVPRASPVASSTAGPSRCRFTIRVRRSGTRPSR